LHVVAVAIKFKEGKVDIGKSFTFVFEDDQWIVKILIGAASLALGALFSWMLLIPLIVAFALLAGYSVEIVRRVIRGELDGLPEWDNWVDLLIDGLKVMVIGIVYALPILILSLCLGVPIGSLNQDAAGVSALLSTCLSCIALLYAIALSLVYPAAIAFFADEGDMAAAFRFSEVFGFVRDHIGTYLITFLMSWVAQFVGNLGSLVCGIGWLVTMPYAVMVTGHLYGQAYVEAKGEAAMALAPVVEEETVVFELDEEEDEG
jgi:hypothetical protein